MSACVGEEVDGGLLVLLSVGNPKFASYLQSGLFGVRRGIPALFNQALEILATNTGATTKGHTKPALALMLPSEAVAPSCSYLPG